VLRCPVSAGQSALFLGALSALAALVIPHTSSAAFGPPYVGTAVVLLALVWLLATRPVASMARGLSDQGQAGRWFRFRWFTLLSTTWIIVFLHAWSRVKQWEVVAVLTIGAAAACAAAYLWLREPARFVHDRLGRPLGAAVSGRPGLAVSTTILGLLVGLWAVSVGEKKRARAEAGSRGRNVIIIALDTVRADRFSLISPDERDRDLTPNMRRLTTDQGTVFTKAISQAPWTLPAFASIYTGLYPAEHGADQRWLVLPGSRLTLAEILREAGYLTVGVVSGPYVSRAPGMSQGYDLFDESQAVGHRTISSAEVTDRTIRFLRAHRDEPLFVFAHYFDPHWVYRDQDDYHFADGYGGDLTDASQHLTQNEFRAHMSASRPDRGVRGLTSGELQYLRNLYDEEIAFTDAQIGRLLRYVREAGLEEESLIVVVGDHGDEFLERGDLWHGKTVYQELVHVPMAIRHPESRGRTVVGQPVETRALFTTILEFLGVPGPDDPRIPPALPPVGSLRETLVRSSTHWRVSGIAGRRFATARDLWWTCIQDERWKLIKGHLGDRTLLYDLTCDPGENQPCATENPGECRRLAEKLDEIDARVCAAAPASVVTQADPALRRRLRALGYL
jgi:arylsulfatase A-like enzyme